ncbi:hypothetical protein K523DRAFT_417276 [Schizophyllum commune Tattone D]|nr:hypothetical protein K523DRAFT_417276 [Schizophyllum commune Tattone D]
MSFSRHTPPHNSPRIPSWHASDHLSMSSERSWHASDRSWHASDHSSTSSTSYRSLTCPAGNHNRPVGDHRVSQTYGTPSDQLRRANHHHRGSTFSFHEGRFSSSGASRIRSSNDERPSSTDERPSSSSDDRLSTSEDDLLLRSASLLSSSGASLPEYTYHISSRERRLRALLQDTIRRLVRSLDPGRPRSLNPGRARSLDFGHVCSFVKRVAGSLDPRRLRSLSKRAFEDIVRRAMKLSKLDLVRKRSVPSIRGALSAEGDSEGSSAGGNAMECSVPSFLPSFLPSSPCRNTYAAPHDWPALEGSDRIGDAGGLCEDAGGPVDNDHAGELDGPSGRNVDYVAGDAFDDLSGFDYVAGEPDDVAGVLDDLSRREDSAGGSVNNDPSSLNDDDNTSTISLLNGEPLADADPCISLHLSSSSTPYAHSSSRIQSWIAGVTGSHQDTGGVSSQRQGARKGSSHCQYAREIFSRGVSKHVAWNVGKDEAPSMSRRMESSASQPEGPSSSQPEGSSTTKRESPKTVSFKAETPSPPTPVFDTLATNSTRQTTPSPTKTACPQAQPPHQPLYSLQSTLIRPSSSTRRSSNVGNILGTLPPMSRAGSHASSPPKALAPPQSVPSASSSAQVPASFDQKSVLAGSRPASTSKPPAPFASAPPNACTPPKLPDLAPNPTSSSGSARAGGKQLEKQVPRFEILLSPSTSLRTLAPSALGDQPAFAKPPVLMLSQVPYGLQNKLRDAEHVARAAIEHLSESSALEPVLEDIARREALEGIAVTVHHIRRVLEKCRTVELTLDTDAKRDAATSHMDALRLMRGICSTFLDMLGNDPTSAQTCNHKQLADLHMRMDEYAGFVMRAVMAVIEGAGYQAQERPNFLEDIYAIYVGDT